MRVAIYTRVGVPAPEANVSMAARRRVLEEYVASHTGWALTDWYFDHGLSFVALQRAVADARRDSYDLLVIHSLDRLGRRPQRLRANVRMIRGAGLRVRIADIDADLSRAMSDPLVRMSLGSVDARRRARCRGDRRRALRLN